MSLVVKRIIFLGTGTSGSVPNVPCLVLNPSCKVCNSCTDAPYSKNRRRNTSILIQIGPQDSDLVKNIIIDVGKTFYDTSVQWFPKYQISNIDAVILTHPHADAVLGIDDLRAWSSISRTPIPIYLHTDTMTTITNMFPYCVEPDKATGGGLVPQLKFHQFDDTTSSINVLGMEFVPLKVQHGEFNDGSPFYCYGYRFEDIVYISDCNAIPLETQHVIQKSKLRLMILDTLRPKPHKSHLSIDQALAMFIHYQPEFAFMFGFTHDLSHTHLIQIASRFFSCGQFYLPELHDKLQICTEDWDLVRGRVQLIMPAFDGLCLNFNPELDLLQLQPQFNDDSL